MSQEARSPRATRVARIQALIWVLVGLIPGTFSIVAFYRSKYLVGVILLATAILCIAVGVFRFGADATARRQGTAPAPMGRSERRSGRLRTSQLILLGCASVEFLIYVLALRRVTFLFIGLLSLTGVLLLQLIKGRIP